MPSDIPHVIIGQQEDPKALYSPACDPAAVRKLPVTIQAGYGVLKKGTVLSENGSAEDTGQDGYYVPYDQDAKTGAENNTAARAYLLQNGASNTSVYVTLNDSYKFAVGDSLEVLDSDSSARDLGAITAIDRTTYSHQAVITVTNQVTTAYTVANYAYVRIKGAGTANGVLEQSVDTGTGSNAKGAVANMVIGNATFWNGVLTNMDSAARTDLGASVYGQHLDLP